MLVYTLLIGIAIGAFFVWRLKQPSLNGSIAQATKTKDIQGILEAIRTRSARVQPTSYNYAIRRLWDSYQRNLAIDLIRELVFSHGTSQIAQYWLKQIQQVEPQLTVQRLGKEFIERYYLPEVAAQCGPVG